MGTWLTGEPRDLSDIPDVQWLDHSGQPMAIEKWAEARLLGMLLYGAGERLCIWFNGDGARASVSMPARVAERTAGRRTRSSGG